LAAWRLALCGVEFNLDLKPGTASQTRALWEEFLVADRVFDDRRAVNGHAGFRFVDVIPARRGRWSGPFQIANGLDIWRRPGESRLESLHACLQARGSHAEVCLADEFWQGPIRQQRQFLFSGVLLTLQPLGLHGLHANGVATGGCGVLICGPSGSGKTSATLSLLTQGWRYLADDAVAICAGGRGVEAHALRRSMSWRGDAWRAFPGLRPGRARFAGEQMAPPGRQARDRWVTRCVPRTLLFSEVARTSRSRLEPLGQTEAVLRLVKQSAGLLTGQKSAEEQIGLLSHLAGQASSYRLLAGRDVYADPPAFSALIMQATGAVPI